MNQRRDDFTGDRSVAEKPFRVSNAHVRLCCCFFFFVRAISRSLALCAVHSRRSDCVKQRGRQCSGAGGKQREGLTGQTLHPLGRFLTFLHFPDHYRKEAVPQRSAVLPRYAVHGRRCPAVKNKKKTTNKRWASLHRGQRKQTHCL